MSIVGAAFERSRWEHAVYATALRTDSGISLTPAQIAKLMDAGLAYGHIEQGRDGFQCARSHAFASVPRGGAGRESDLARHRIAIERKRSPGRADARDEAASPEVEVLAYDASPGVEPIARHADHFCEPVSFSRIQLVDSSSVEFHE